MPKEKEPTIVSILRMRLVRHGVYPRDTWRPQVELVEEVEIGTGVTAADVFEYARTSYRIPRHELALADFPEQKEFEGEGQV